MSPVTVLWGLRTVLRHGVPDRVIDSYVGIGDELMTAIALRYLKPSNGGRKPWFLTRYPELHAGTNRHVTFLPWDARYFRLAYRFRRPASHLHYSQRDEVSGVDRPLPGRYIENFARQLGVVGAIELRPSIALTAPEHEKGRIHPNQVAVQSSAAGARIAISAKQWPVDRMQEVVSRLTRETGVNVVQLGTANEPALQNVTDLRGKLTLRETGAVLANSRLFVGMAGGLMHLARSVDCPAVIVYGGREDPRVAGYIANINLATRPDCSPCYLIKPCPHGMVCMDSISSQTVFDACGAQLNREPHRLAVETVTIAA